MPVFLGNKGAIKLRRSTAETTEKLTGVVNSDDVVLRLNRFSFDGSSENLLIGDRVTITTTDNRKLAFVNPAAWRNGIRQESIAAYINVNAVGGIRLFPDFKSAVNNDRTKELALSDFSGEPIEVTITVKDWQFNVLGDVTGYQFFNERDSIDTTTLSDKFKHHYNAGLLSGGGSIDCLFNYTTTGIKEVPLLLLQLIQRLDIGASFDLALYLTDEDLDPRLTNLYYLIHAIITRVGVQVVSGEIVKCSIDFISTGEIKLLLGAKSDFILQESYEPIELEQGLGGLLQQTDD